MTCNPGMRPSSAPGFTQLDEAPQSPRCDDGGRGRVNAVLPVRSPGPSRRWSDIGHQHATGEQGSGEMAPSDTGLGTPAEAPRRTDPVPMCDRPLSASGTDAS